MSKRLFANNQTIDFNEYLKNKKGLEIIKNLKSKKIKINQRIDFYLSFEDFMIITKTYYSNLIETNFCFESPVNIFNSNNSFIIYENMIEHFKDCNNCKKYNKNINKLYECKGFNQILYPYGNNLINKTYPSYYLHNKIDLDNFCNSIKSLKTNNDENNNSNFNIFPSQNNFIRYKQDDYLDEFEKTKRMNAYANFPNLKCDQMIEFNNLNNENEGNNENDFNNDNERNKEKENESDKKEKMNKFKLSETNKIKVVSPKKIPNPISCCHKLNNKLSNTISGCQKINNKLKSPISSCFKLTKPLPFNNNNKESLKCQFCPKK